LKGNEIEQKLIEKIEELKYTYRQIRRNSTSSMKGVGRKKTTRKPW